MTTPGGDGRRPRLLIDTADVETIRRTFEAWPLVGVTTNPSSIARERLELPTLLTAIREAIGAEAELHVQVLARDAAGIIREAQWIRRLAGPGTVVKVAATREGLTAARRLADDGVAMTVTTIFSTAQALIAAAAGARYVAPYVNRLDAAGGDGVGLVDEIVRALAAQGSPTQVLAASFRDPDQVVRSFLAGASACTLPPETLDALSAHPLTDESIAGFERDWVARFGTARLTEL
jgi:TalC/MipB family fructose-6-phosphate aldolase